MSQDVNVVQLVLPEGMREIEVEPAPAEHGTSAWLITGVVLVVVMGNALLVWWRVRGRDPMKRAFDGVATKLGLSRAERRRVEELAAGKMEPVAMLVSGAALERAGVEEPLIVSVRQKRERMSASGRG